MSYRLINSNDLNGVVSYDEYEKILKMPCIYVDIPDGMDGKHYCLTNAIEQEPCEDCISRKAVLDALNKWDWQELYLPVHFKDMIDDLPSIQLNKWIPLKTRPMTEEETTFYRDWSEYGAEIFDCPLPDDGQEVLVSWGGMVCVDTFVKDCDGCYFEGVDIDDVVAWMPLPEAYKGDSE